MRRIAAALLFAIALALLPQSARANPYVFPNNSNTCVVSNGNVSQTLTCTTPSGLANNDWMLFCTSFNNTGSAATPSGWTLDPNFSDANSGFFNGSCFWKCANNEPGTESISITQPTGGGTGTGIIWAVRGTYCTNAISPIDATAHSHGGSTTPSFPALSATTATGDMIIHIISSDAGGPSYTPPTGDTLGVSNYYSAQNQTAAVSWSILGAAGTTISSTTGTFGSSAGYASFSGTLKPGAVGFVRRR